MTDFNIGKIAFGPAFKDFDKFFVGFEDSAKQFKVLHDDLTKNIPNYPPYNIVKTGSLTYNIEVALAGYSKKDVSVSFEDNILKIESVKSKEEKEVEDNDGVLHKGIAKRNFMKHFTIADDIEVKGAELKDGFILTNFKSGKVFLNYQATLEDEGGNLLTLDHPYCNEYYEYALKSRILENMIFAGENVSNQSSMIEQRLRAARNNALSFVNTPNFEEYRKIWEVNRKSQYNKYYDMFSSFATNRRS